MRKLLSSLLVLTIFATACSGATPGAAPDRDSTIDLSNDDIRLLSRLVPFQSCSDLLSHLQSEAGERVGPYGLDYYGYGYFGGGFEGDVDFETAAEESADFDSAPQAASEPAFDGGGSDDSAAVSTGGGEGGDAGFTGTNVQELGVDEPDIIKTDGDRIIVVANNTLTYIDISGDEPVTTDQIDLSDGWGHELFFQGDRALLFTNGGGWGGGPFPVEPGILDSAPAIAEGDAETEFAPDVDIEAPIAPEWYGPAATIIEVDLSDPTDLEIASTLRIQGEYLNARRVGDTVRLALNSPPSQLEWVYPSSQAGEDRAERFNRELLEETVIEDWIPEFELTNAGGTTRGPLLDCDRLHRPADFSGFDIVSVLSFDLDGGLDSGSGAGVLASGRTVYASSDRFYVATTAWAGTDVVDGDGFEVWEENYTTDIHGFSISTDEPADYVASGMVDGSLLNQFSMDEHEGYLRMITTDGSPWNEGRNQSETMLTVLAEDGDTLVQVGQVGGIGKGESLFSARLLDDVGFAVTFRQVDPFYVLDLSDPTDPKVTGELKIPGVSTYLHPVSDKLVLGIGQDGTEDGRLIGLKVSLFDVSDPSDPREVATWTMANANSPAEHDHRAFQFLPEDGIAILPVQSWSNEFNGAVVLEIGDETITELGRVSHVPESTEPTTDCEVLDSSNFPEDTELFWIAEEGGRVQFCDEFDNGGYGGWYCDPIPVDDLRYYGPEDVMETVITDLTDGEPSPEDRLEFCYPDGGNYQEQIQRSLVVGDDLWTMSWAQLQSNHLIELNVQDVLPL